MRLNIPRSKLCCRSKLIAPVLLIGILFGGNTVSAQAPQTHMRKSEKRRELPITDFYNVPVPLPPAKPGTLIRSEAFDDYDLSADMSALRILYHSRSGSGKDVAVSGVVLIPQGKPPNGGWPVIAWAHSFSGVARRCAPSLMTNIFDGPLLSMYLSLGYAVAATDYAGLGTGSRYAALDTQSNAEDVINAVAAAHAATPGLSSKWIAVGDLQGAAVAIRIAELPGARDPDYLGSVAISEVADPQNLFESLMQTHFAGIFSVLAYGVKTVFPEFKPGDMLTDKGTKTFAEVESTCGVPDSPDVAGREMLQSGWEKNSYVAQFLARNTIGLTPTHEPVLVIIGGSDALFSASLTSQLVKQMCQQHDHVIFDEFPNVDRGSVLGTSVSDQISWIQARFSGRPEASNCK